MFRAAKSKGVAYHSNNCPKTYAANIAGNADDVQTQSAGRLSGVRPEAEGEPLDVESVALDTTVGRMWRDGGLKFRASIN